MTEPVRLIEPELEFKNEFYQYCKAFKEAHEPDLPFEALAYSDFTAYIQKLKDLSTGAGYRPGFVPVTAFWLVRDDRSIIGNSSLRHRLTPALEDMGGHIGYAIRPLERHKGYGTLLLQLTLEKAKEIGLRRVLITCGADNAASAGVIIKNGGVLASQDVSIQTDKLTSRYWIDLSV